MTRSRWLRKSPTSAPNQRKNMGQTYNRLSSILESYVTDSSTRQCSGEGQDTGGLRWQSILALEAVFRPSVPTFLCPRVMINH
jgi:hypothetical protein